MIQSLWPRVFTPTGGAYFKCDHQRSVFLYLESLKQTCKSRAFPCASYQDFLDGLCVDCAQFGTAGCPVVGQCKCQRQLILTFECHFNAHTAAEKLWLPRSSNRFFRTQAMTLWSGKMPCWNWARLNLTSAPTALPLSAVSSTTLQP